MEINGREYEHEALAEAGVTLSDGVRWWGTRIKYRVRGNRRWSSFVLVDVHPFDYDAVSNALALYLKDRA